MPYCYADRRPDIRQLILDRIAKGERLKHIGREEGMPCPESVTGWARRDPAFRAALDQAYRTGKWRREEMFDEVRARTLLTRLQGGESQRTALAAPGTPSQRTLRLWRMNQGEFAEAVFRVNETRAAEKAARARNRYRAFDQRLADRLVVWVSQGKPMRKSLAADPQMPALGVVARWRRENPEFAHALGVAIRVARRRRRPAIARWSPRLAEAVCDLLLTGASLREVGRRPGMPCAATLRNWMRTRPEFAAQVAQACEWREDWFADQAGMACERGRLAEARRLMGEAGRMRLRRGA